MANKAGKTHSLFWLIAIVLIYICSVFIYVGTYSTPQKLTDALIDDRTSNEQISQSSDRKAWELANQNGISSPFLKKVGVKIGAKESVINDKNGVIENIWSNSSENAVIYGLIIDYRLYFLLLIMPLIGIVAVSAICDAFLIRKKDTFKNSFSSPLKHNLGGRVIALPSTFLIIFCLLLPASIPAYFFIILSLLKIFGWWLWVVNLPKRI